MQYTKELDKKIMDMHIISHKSFIELAYILKEFKLTPEEIRDRYHYLINNFLIEIQNRK